MSLQGFIEKQRGIQAGLIEEKPDVTPAREVSTKETLAPSSMDTNLIEQFRQKQEGDISHQQTLIETTPFLDMGTMGTTSRTTTPETGTPEQMAKPSKVRTGWNWLSKQLMKPVGVVAAESEALGLAIRTGKAPVPFEASLDILAGKREF